MQKVRKKAVEAVEIKSVIFVQETENSELVRRLSETELSLQRNVERRWWISQLNLTPGKVETARGGGCMICETKVET